MSWWHWWHWPSEFGFHRPAGLHYDFIEVGTSDWGTIAQACAGGADSCWGSWVASYIKSSAESLQTARGLAVEPVSEYLDKQPDPPPRVTKVLAAMGEHSSEGSLYCVSAENVDRHYGQYHTA